MATQTWNVDLSHSGISFSVRHLMISKVRGSFNQWSASALIDDADLSKSTAEAKIQVASVDTKEAKRDGHLKSADFFDVEKFPEMTFKSKRVEGKGDVFKVVGDLTMHGVTREVVLDVTREGGGKDPWGNERQGFSAKTSLDRGDYGLKWNQALEAGGVVVGDKVSIEIELEAVKAKA